MSNTDIERWLGAVPVIREIKTNFYSDYKCLLAEGLLAEYQKGEEVVSKGAASGSISLLLKGSVEVRLENQVEKVLLWPGEWLGETSMSSFGTRSATVTADTDNVAMYFLPKNIIMHGMGLSESGWLTLLKNICQGLRWKIEQCRMKYPDAELLKRLRLLPNFSAQDDDITHWRTLFEAMVELLLDWNEFQAQTLS